MTARATSKTFGQFSSFEAIKSILSLNAKDPDNAPLAGDSATFVDANGNPKTAVYGPTGWYIEGVGKESPDSTSLQFDRAVVAPNLQDSRYPLSVTPSTKSRTIGFNAYDLLAAKLDGNSTGDNSALLDYVVQCKGRFVRVMYPVYDAAKWGTQIFESGIPARDFVDSDFRSTFLAASDALFSEFVSRGLLMHACLFWNRANTAVACGETDATGYTSTSTATVQFMQRFAKWFAVRYSSNPALGIVSFGNEWNPTELDSGSPVTAAQLGAVFSAVGAVVKGVDKSLPVTANQIAIPIEAIANRVTMDAGISVYETIFATMDAWCLHIYAVSGYVGRSASYSGAPTGVLAANNYGYEFPRAMVAAMSDAARSRGKLFIIGETGMNDTQALDAETTKRRRFLQPLSEHADYTMVWNLQPAARAATTGQTAICIDPGSTRATSWKTVVAALNNSSSRSPLLVGVGSAPLLARYSPAKCFSSSRVANGHISIPSPAALGAGGFSIAMWVRHDAVQQTSDRYCNFRDAGDNTGPVVISSNPVGNLYGSFKSGGVALGNSSGLFPNFVQGAWYHVVICYNPLTPFVVDLFLNGVFWGTTLLSAGFVDIASGSSFIVAAATVGGTGVPASFQDVACFPHALSVDDVMRHAQGEVSPTAAIHLRATGGGIADVSRYAGVVTIGAAVTQSSLR